jgi:hypothetical protein
LRPLEILRKPQKLAFFKGGIGTIFPAHMQLAAFFAEVSYSQAIRYSPNTQILEEETGRPWYLIAPYQVSERIGFLNTKSQE